MTETRRLPLQDPDASLFVIHSSMKLSDVKDFFTINRNEVRAVYVHKRYDDDDMKSIIKEIKHCPKLERLKFLDADLGITGKEALESYIMQLFDRKPRLKYVEFETREPRKFKIDEPRFRMAIKRQGSAIVEVGSVPGVDRVIRHFPPMKST